MRLRVFHFWNIKEMIITYGTIIGSSNFGERSVHQIIWLASNKKLKRQMGEEINYLYQY